MLEGCTPWPAGVAERYRALGYWRGESLGDLLQQWSHRFSSRTALIYGDQRVTFGELARRVDAMAAGFGRYGIGPGDRVVVQLPNVPEFIIVFFALLRMDAKPVFSLPAHRTSEIRHLCELSEAVGYVTAGREHGFDSTALTASARAGSPGLRHVFVMGERPGEGAVPLADVVGEPIPMPVPDPADVAFFLLSGGTTALPKLIPRTHDDYAYQIGATAKLVRVSEQDVYLAALPAPFNFTWGCPGILGTLSVGGTVVLADDPRADECFALIETERVTFTSLVPAVAQFWLEAAAEHGLPSLSSLRLIQIGGAPLPREVAERIAPIIGCPPQQVFGMAEGLLSFTRLDDPPERVLATVGQPLSPADEIRVADESGRDLPPGHEGELLARGPYTLRGYYRAPEHNSRSFTAGGFYRTGDLAMLTRAGDLVICGRLKDVIIRGGNKISAAEVEECLLAVPGVGRAAVVPVPDPVLGERICAYIRPIGDPPTLRGLRAALHAMGIAEYKLPDHLEVVTDLPLTGLGKVDKKLLVKDAAARAAGSPA